MGAYEEILFEIGELPPVLQTASPLTRLVTLICFNTGLVVASEILVKFFRIDVLNILAAFTGVQMPSSGKGVSGEFHPTTTQKPTTSKPNAFPAFSSNFGK